jgi:iron complex transport system ATP-binding protein
MIRQAMSMIKVGQLSAGYKTQKEYLNVLKDISFEVWPGELVCLMGPNGAGKSTLLRCICGLQNFRGGNISIEEQPLEKLKANEMSRKLAVVLTEQIAASHMTVRELIAMGRYPHLGWLLKYTDHDNELIIKTASDCGIANLLDHYIHSLSDGQRQKAFIARALVQESQLLVLDEPTSHLDLNNRVEIISLLKHISRKDGKAVIMATHELDLALQMADRLLLLNSRGELFQGIPEDLVLNGKIDEVFAFKGYDLKTGKVEHLQSGQSINLEGEGYIYLWTRNALEREGYMLTESADKTVYINEPDGKIEWLINSESFSDIQSLLFYLKEKSR